MRSAIGFIAISLFPAVTASSMYLAEKCRGGFCPDSQFPILDFDQDKRECICRAHPCWNTPSGVQHTCSEDSGFPFLHFTHDANQELKCSCSSVPQYDSIYLSRDKCAGHSCDSTEFPVLDLDAQQDKCFCRVNPCEQMSDGKHECKNPAFPIAHYREEFTADHGAQPICECKARMVPPVSRLRGALSKDQVGQCSWHNLSW